MSSPQVQDSASRQRSLAVFFAQQTAEKRMNAQKSAQERADEVYKAKDGQFDMTSTEQQMGRPLTRSVIAERLRKMNRNLIVERTKNYPDKAGIYVHDNVSNMTDKDERCRGRRYLGVGMEWGLSTEFSVVTPQMDEYGTPVKASVRKGWRTVLAQLIQLRMITLEQAEKSFEISKGRDSENWWLKLQ